MFSCLGRLFGCYVLVWCFVRLLPLGNNGLVCLQMLGLMVFVCAYVAWLLFDVVICLLV